MTSPSPLSLGSPFALADPSVQHSARLDRLALGVNFLPASAALAAASGIVHGPAGSMGELTLVSDGVLRVNPFVAVIQGTHTARQGQYVVPNEEQRDLAVVAKDASLQRRSLIVVRVADSTEAGVAASATTNGAWIERVDGTAASSSPALPPLPANSVALGELLVPSSASGQPVQLTPYNPRTGARHGILPVAADSSTVPGHGAAPGVHPGQYRDHATAGLQRWDGALWGDPLLRPMVRARRSTNFAHTSSQNWVPIPMEVADINLGGMWSTGNLFDVIAPRAGIYRVGCGTYVTGTPVNGRVVVKISKFHAADSTWRETWIGRSQAHGTGNGFDPGVETHGLLYLAANDRIRLDVFQDTAASIALGSVAWQPTFLEAEYIRP